MAGWAGAVAHHLISSRAHDSSRHSTPISRGHSRHYDSPATSRGSSPYNDPRGMREIASRIDSVRAQTGETSTSYNTKNLRPAKPEEVVEKISKLREEKGKLETELSRWKTAYEWNKY
jgi:hypothetical protein